MTNFQTPNSSPDIYTHTSTHKRRQSSLIKNDAVGPLLSKSSCKIRIFMGVYLSHFCLHKHAEQQWVLWYIFSWHSLPLNLPLCLSTWHLVFETLHCIVSPFQSLGLIVAWRPVVTQNASWLYTKQQDWQLFIDIILLRSGSGQRAALN